MMIRYIKFDGSNYDNWKYKIEINEFINVNETPGETRKFRTETEVQSRDLIKHKEKWDTTKTKF